MFTPLPTDAVAALPGGPDPVPSGTVTHPAPVPARLAALADALVDLVTVRLTSAADGTTGARHAAVAVTPRTPDEVVQVVLLAREHGVPVAVPGDGHGDEASRDGAVLVSPVALLHLEVLPVLRRAHAGPGVRWGTLVAAAARYGLVPVAAAARVTVVGQLVGADVEGVRAVDVVTADGVLRRTSPTDDADLFRAVHDGGPLRPGRRAAGVVVGVELDLVERGAR
ncbi:FAD-binding protein [Cellulomonas sp. Sa3CUA2]|uniref:FAD-binding protein n=1 Tax=Cellulomonas avistercoris TaxID=2762242 RepID=A0ABR8QBN0_9CELL|nr:FAD-binding protein [Cellulomonas avistercoris]MBD7917839.1 FAD-binding protein [Cellulomonas avistercoris]